MLETLTLIERPKFATDVANTPLSMQNILLSTSRLGYRFIIKPFLFLQNPEFVHVRTMNLAERLGRSRAATSALSSIFHSTHSELEQKLFDLTFQNPIGLAAGFDYEARLTQILPAFDFGFGTVGTLTNLPYEGNSPPMLGRLPESKSLMVNKGFKNRGVIATLNTLDHATFKYPVGVSIGKTNTAAITTQEQAVRDVIQAFTAAEASPVPFSYYELNISCPNLKGSVEFYEPAHLAELLEALSALRLKKPVWIKMPLTKTDAEALTMLEVITRYPFIQAVIFGNLQRDRGAAAFKQSEVSQFTKGNFSGLPCQARSDELIALAFKKYGDRIKVIGCGGVFSAADAYRKITLGASLVQLITGLVYEGPQLVAQINKGLSELLQKDDHPSISDAVGSKNR